MIRILCVLITVFGFGINTYGLNKRTEYKLWFTSPAQNWNEAIPIGNGFLGAMVFGDVNQERLQLNECTLYSGDPATAYKQVNITRDFDSLVNILRNGKYNIAQQYVKKNWQGRLHQYYQPMSDLYIDFKSKGEVTEYKRELDLDCAVFKVKYKQNGITYTREIFANNPDNVIIIRLKADKPNALNFTARFTSEHPTAKQLNDGSNGLSLVGQAPGYVERRTFEQMEAWGEQYKHPELYDEQGKRRYNKRVLYGDEIGGRGMYFNSRIKVVAQNGKVLSDNTGVHVTNSNDVLIILSAATSFNGYDKSPTLEGVDAQKKANTIITSAVAKGYKVLLKNHLSDYQRLFGRVQLNLSSPDSIHSQPTDQRLLNFKKSGDNQLSALLFQYGRYLLISSSRKGGQPANLQGIWNKDVIPPWNSGYTININTQMNYWPAEVTNLSECTEPLFRMVNEMSVTGRETAQKMYGRKGWVAHHNVSIWRETFPNDGDPRAAFWNLSPGWLTQHFWQHYLYSGNLAFLKSEAYPLMKGAAEFYANWLVDNGSGKLVTPVSTTPENTFFMPGTTIPCQVSMGTTMDMAIIRELFSAVVTASEILNTDVQFRESIKQKLALLLPYQVGSKGQLQEWQHDFVEAEPNHRHLSHLWGLHPGSQITPDKSPELYKAAARTLELRGDEATGWSMGWKINFWARMLDGNHAHKIIQNLFNLVDSKKISGMTGGGLYRNMLDAHPPFQIDGNFGYTAGVAEMLLQSHNGAIHLLPALPDSWKSGEVKGLKARGAFEVDIKWENNLLQSAKIKALNGGSCCIRSAQKLIIKGAALSSSKSDNELMQPVIEGNSTFIAPKNAIINSPKINYEYYIHTKIGDEITLSASKY